MGVQSTAMLQSVAQQRCRIEEIGRYEAGSLTTQVARIVGTAPVSWQTEPFARVMKREKLRSVSCSSPEGRPPTRPSGGAATGPGAGTEWEWESHPAPADRPSPPGSPRGVGVTRYARRLMALEQERMRRENRRAPAARRLFRRDRLAGE